MNNIGIIGVGKLGLPYALSFEHVGFNVYASSYKKEYVEALQNGTYESTEPEVLDYLTKAKNITFTIDNHIVIDKCDFIYVMVATPSTDAGDYDTSAVTDVANDFLKHNGNVTGKVLIVGSTVNPGDCDKLQELLNPAGVHVVYCPTFVAQGEVMRLIRDPHTLAIGTDNKQIARKCKDIFESIVPITVPFFIFKRKTLEILKLAGNGRSTLLISFFNFIGQVLLSEGLEDDLEHSCYYLNYVKRLTSAEEFDVTDTTTFGNIKNQLKFGYGFGGPCYPRDNKSLTYYTNNLGLEYPYGTITDEFNHEHANFLSNFLMKKNVRNFPYYFEYVSYKKGVAIFEESHQLQVCKNLLTHGKIVYIEPTEFLLQEIVDELSKEFPDQVIIKSLRDIDTKIYNATAIIQLH